MSVKEFPDRDADHLGWVAAHRDGYVINIGRSGRGYARLHRATWRHDHQQARFHWSLHQDLVDRANRTRSMGATPRRHDLRALQDVPADGQRDEDAAS